MIDHVIFSFLTQAFECQHCGSQYKPALPLPVEQVVSMGKGFMLMHKHCVRRLEPSKQVALFDALAAKDPERVEHPAANPFAECEWLGQAELRARTMPVTDAIGRGPDPGIDAMTDEPAPEIDPPGPPSRHGPGPLLEPVELRHLVTCVRPKEFWPSLKEVETWHPEVRADVQRWCRVAHSRAHPIAGQGVPHDFTMPNVLENVEFARAAKAKKPRGARPLTNGRKKAK